MLSNRLETIYSIPHHMRGGRESDFEPNFVSIGPNFHGRENLRDMENRKAQFALDLDQNLPTKDNIIETLITSFRSLESRARACYADNIDLDSSKFLKMLALDSCFIIQVITAAFNGRWESTDLLCFDIKQIRSDLLLLENQIPLFTVETAFYLVCSRRTSENSLPCSFSYVLEKFIRLDMPMIFNENGMFGHASHLLERYWRCCFPIFGNMHPPEFISEHTNSGVRCISAKEEFHLTAETKRLTPSASMLHRTAGVTFTALDVYPDRNWVRFQGGTLIMPCLKIDPGIAKLLLNLIAFEYFKDPGNRICMSFVLLFDALIDSEEDVALLQEKGVISNKLRSNEQAATFFNDISNFCSDARTCNFFASVCKEMKDFYESISNRQLASLRRNYCSSPWAIISLVAGASLLIMSFLQTFYTLYAYYHPR
jgi:Plant protein of unknown function